MMMRNLVKIGAVCALITGLMAGVVFAQGEVESMRIAIFPCTDVVTSFKKFNPLVSYLRAETGLDLQLAVPMDFEELKRDIINDAISFVFQDPYIYVRLAPLYDESSLTGALTRDGEMLQTGVVIVRKDSGIGGLKDLVGKTVMFGPKMSTPKWMAAKLLFKENGLDIDTDLKSYANGTCCENIAFSVYLKAVDAGVVCDHFLGEHSSKQKELGLEAENLSVIGRTRPVPTKVFAARKGVREDAVVKVVQALLRLDNADPDHKAILYRAELGGFLAAGDENYDSIKVLFGVTADE